MARRDQAQDRNLPTDQPDDPRAHHDALEFPNGEVVLLTFLAQGQEVQFFSYRLRLLMLKYLNERPTFDR